MCLDTLAASKNIYAHVSKPPKNGTVTAQFLQVRIRVQIFTISLYLFRNQYKKIYLFIGIETCSRRRSRRSSISS